MTVLDANVVLEILELRQRFSTVLKTLEYYQSTVTAVSTLTVSNVFYLAERHRVSLHRVETLVKPYKIFPVLEKDVDWALSFYQGKDFEDALQVGAALRENCTVFLTIDQSLAAKYSKFLKIELIQ